MKCLVSITAISIALALVCCGPRADGKTPDEEAGSGQTDAAKGGVGEGMAVVSKSCNTTPDCDEGLTCVDGGCVVLAPGGFY
jgi:hypothetical protein